MKEHKSSIYVELSWVRYAEPMVSHGTHSAYGRIVRWAEKMQLERGQKKGWEKVGQRCNSIWMVLLLVMDIDEGGHIGGGHMGGGHASHGYFCNTGVIHIII